MSFKRDMSDYMIMQESRYLLDNYRDKVDTDTLSMGLVAVFSKYINTDYTYNVCLLLEEEYGYELHELLKKAFHQCEALRAFGDILRIMEYKIRQEG